MILLIIIITAIITIIAISVILFIKTHKSQNIVVVESPEYKQALASLSTSVRGGIMKSWNSFLTTASNRQSLIDPRDTFESFPQYFPSDVGMSADKLSGKNITDPYELLLFYVNGIYKSIGTYGDDDSDENEKACIEILQNTLKVFGSNSPAPTKCGVNTNFILTGDAKLEGTNISWNDYFNSIKSSTKNNYQHLKVKYQYWIKGISPLPTLNDLDNMALLIISQCTSSLSIFNDLLDLADSAGADFLTGAHKSDTAKVTSFHELRKVLRSLIRTFTEFCACSPLTFYEGCYDKSGAGILTCTSVQCCTAAKTSIAACMKKLSGKNFKEIMEITNNPKLTSLTAIALLGEKSDCDFNKNCESTCTPSKCTLVSTPAENCGINGCTGATGCNWINCDLVSWFGNIHDNMVQYLPALKDKYSNVEQLRIWINEDVSNIIIYLKLYLPKYLFHIMYSSWKESFVRACQSDPGQKMLRGPSNKSEDGWICWNDSLDILKMPEYKINNCVWF